MFELHPTEISGVLQSTIAPAFLLAGIGTFVNVMSQRLSRVVDLAREYPLDDDGEGVPRHYEATRISLTERVHDTLARRAQLMNRAIVLSTAAAVMVCLLIAVQFTDALVTVDLSLVVAVAFLLTMGTLIVALATFLREVLLATKTLRKAYLRAGRRPLREAD
jgi:hypothetical protein